MVRLSPRLSPRHSLSLSANQSHQARSRVCVRVAATLFVLLVLNGALIPVQAAIIRVGFEADPNCDAASIEEAFEIADDNGEFDEIRISPIGGHAEDNSYTSSETLVISGGWINCGATTSAGYSLVVGESLEDLATFTFSGSSVDVTLRNLRIQGDGTTQVAILANNNAQVRLENVSLEEATTGLVASNGADVVVDAASFIQNNDSPTAANGAGIDCADSSIDLQGDVINNHGIDGGGIRASGSCFIELFPGAVIASNTATRGGGVFLETGAVMGGGGGLTRAFVNENTANEGGAYYITDSGTRASHFNLHVKDNEAVLQGGAIVATNGGAFTMNKSNTVDCSSPCSLLSGNMLTGPGNYAGSAGTAIAGGSITLYQTHVEQNSDLNEVGDLLRAGGTGSTVELEGVSIWDNIALYLVAATGGGSATLAYSSIARNDYNSGGGRTDSIAMSEVAGGQSSAYSSAFTDISGFSGDVFGSCVMANNLNNMSGIRLSLSDPQFLDPAHGNLRLKPSSPAIDYCDGTTRPPTRRDIDLDLRPIDSTAHADLHGPYDLGIDEVEPSTFIFIDGFESGSPSAWATTSP